MYFTTFNHYDDDTLYNDTICNDEICLICWEPHTTNNHIYKMKTVLSTTYSPSCTCNGKFHHDCLLKWIYMSQSCPICRIKIDIVDDNDEKLPLTFNVLNIYILLKYLFLFCLVKTLFDLQFSIENRIEENQCHLN
jgi:hypothetical protein